MTHSGDFKKNISVLIYSYKSKNVIETLNNMLEKSSKEYNFFIYWYDQNGLDRSKLLIDLTKSNQCHGTYISIHWDNIDGSVMYKEKGIRSIDNSEYCLIISPGVSFNKDWDKKLINFIKDKNIIISGNNKIKITKSNLFYIKKENETSDNFLLTRYIDRFFMFGKTNTMRDSRLGGYSFPIWLKYYGEEELLSLQYFKDSVDIFSCPENIIKSSKYTTLEDFNYYITFSKNHNYNQVLSLFKNGVNEIVGKIDTKIINDFCNFHSFDFSSLEYLPFYAEDVNYDRDKSKYDKIDGNRFLKPIRKVN